MVEQELDLTDTEEERAVALHADAVVIDGLAICRNYFETEGYVDHLHRGGVNAGNFTVAHSGTPDFESCVDELVRLRDGVETRDDAVVVESAADLRAAKAAGDIAVIVGFQASRPIGTDLRRLRAFDHLGTRIVQLTYNDQNYVGAGCCERNDGGLTCFGRDLIDELQARNILIDLSHCGDTTTEEAVEYADDPVAFTHVGVRELCPAYGRCKTDEQIRAVAEGGGVIGLTLFPPFVRRDPDTHKILPATIQDVLDAIDHVVNLVGSGHVGFGTDINDVYLDEGRTPAFSSLRTYRPRNPEVFGHGPVDRYDPFPAGLDRHTKLPNLTRGLVARGYTDDEIRGILGENFLRLFETVWEG